MKLRNFLTILFVFLVNVAWALDQNTERWLDLEWDPVEGAIAYEVELLEIKEGRYYNIGTFKTDVSRWTKNVRPGKYAIKMRSLDSRGVGGEWSEEIPVPVKLPFPQKSYPKPGEIFEVEDGKGKEIFFQWEATAGASFYKLNIFDENERKFYSTVTADLQTSLNLEKLIRYEWEVLPLFTKDEQISEKVHTQPFTLIGGELKTPDLESKVLDKEVLIVWQKVENAKTYELELVQEIEGKQESLEKKTLTLPQYKLNKEILKPGLFTVYVKATSKGYKDSPTAELIYAYDKKIIKQVSSKKEASTYRRKDYIETSLGLSRVDYEAKHYEQDTHASQAMQGILFYLGWNKNLGVIDSQTYLRYLTFSDTYASTTFTTVGQSFSKVWTPSNFSWGIRGGVEFDRVSLLTPKRTDITSSDSNDRILVSPLASLIFSYRAFQDWTFSYVPIFTYHAKALSSPGGSQTYTSYKIEQEVKATYNLKSNLDLFFKGLYSYDKYSYQAKTGGTSLAKSSDTDSFTLNNLSFSLGLNWFYE